jgi:hypothetical protein
VSARRALAGINNNIIRAYGWMAIMMNNSISRMAFADADDVHPHHRYAA